MIKVCLNAALAVVLIAFIVLTARKREKGLSSSIINDDTDYDLLNATPLKPSTQQLALACKFINIMDLDFCPNVTSFGSNVVMNGFKRMPSEIGFLTQLTSLSVCSNMLTGTIPSTLGNLVNLKELNLERNKFTGTIPSTLGNLNQLTHLQMDTILVTGTVPSTFGNLVQLTSLYLMNIPELQGTIPSALCKSSPAGLNRQVIIDCKNIGCSCCRPFGFSTSCCRWCFWRKAVRDVRMKWSDVRMKWSDTTYTL